MRPDLFICKNYPAGVVQRRLEGEASQVVVVLQVDMVPLNHQSSTWRRQTHSVNSHGSLTTRSKKKYRRHYFCLEQARNKSLTG